MEIIVDKKLLNRFWPKVAITANPDRCWEWQAMTHPTGYGMIKINGKGKLAHRISYLIHNKVLPKDLCVCHKCDNRKCVNPNHFFLGTLKDNFDDMRKKGRHARGITSGRYTKPEKTSRGDSHYARTSPERLAFGERANKSQLKESDVIEIRRRYAESKPPTRQLAREYGLTQRAICMIIHRVSWKHI